MISPRQAFARDDDWAIRPPRDFVGYGATPPRVAWPGGAKLALQVVHNYEEGSERSYPMGDSENEGFHEFPMVLSGQRDLDVESVYEYGSRAGVWRLFRIFDGAGIPVTCFATAVALARNPAVAEKLVARRDEVASHGFRWIEHYELSRDIERDWIRLTVEALTKLVGKPPVGWYCRQMSVHTRELLVEHGGFEYDSDAYNDDLPYWTNVSGRAHLVVPYTLTVNDAHFLLAPTFANPDDFFEYGRRAIDRLCHDGDDIPRMMSVGLHARIAGQPARADAVARLLDYAARRDDVWVARRIDIAREFARQVPAPQGATRAA
jgi:peptidoglycan/xylan/chitin deacetylase (PgdA/CDA1 family)